MVIVHDLQSAMLVLVTAFIAAIGWHLGGWAIGKVTSVEIGKR